MKKYTFILALFFLPTFALAYQEADLERVANAEQWHRLLHFRRTIPFQLHRSYVDGVDYFFAEDGYKNPRAELEASIAAFSKDIKVGKLKQHPQCAFPERFRYLKEQLALNVAPVKCEKFDEFLGRFNAESATLVFSSAYPNNPGSMFGHTFVRINAKHDYKNKKEKKLDILDYGLSFAAAVGPDENGFAFIWFGLTGGYLGQFSMLPYYTKINEYTNAESRDVWEYDLNLTSEETQRLLAHVWELETSGVIDYYFFDENCAFWLMKSIEIAKPEWDTGDFMFYAIPGETVKRITRIPGAVKSVKFRPSFQKRLTHEVALLTDEQRDEFSAVLAMQKPISVVSDPRVLDSVSNYLFYEKQKAEGKQSDNDKALQKSALVRRAQLGSRAMAGAVSAEETSQIQGTTRPDLGHHSYRLSTASGVGQRGDGNTAFFQEFHWKSAYHDLLNKDLGFQPNSQINFPNVTFRYTPSTGRITLENLELLNIVSLFPLGFLEKRLSWKWALDYRNPKDLACVDCNVLRTEAGVGATVDLGYHSLLYALASANVEVGRSLRKGYRFGPKVEAAALLNPLENYKTKLSATLFFDVVQSDRRAQYFQYSWDHSLSLNQEWELRASLLYAQHSELFGSDAKEAKLILNFYF